MSDYLNSVIKRFEGYKKLGEDTFAQITDEGLFWQYNADSNSIAIIVQHIVGNMLSRWTDFLTSAGEKEWRKRDEEFESTSTARDGLLCTAIDGWACLLNGLSSLNDDDAKRSNSG